MIFKPYDIRGIYPSELNEDIAYRIGRAFVELLKVKSVVVGMDARLSSPKLAAALTNGLTDQGADVVHLGLCSTPMFYFCSKDAEASIMVTASHNPKQFNGFKLCRKNGFPISQKNGIKDIQKLVEKKFKDKKKGVVVKKNCMDFYIKYCLKFVHGSPKLKIVLDAGNGMCGYTFPKIFRGIEAELVELYTKLDFTFPHHEPNPLKYQTLKDLQRKVVKEKANFGVATDGDGDRCVFIDEKGEIITADLVLALIAEYILRKNHGAAIMYDVRCSKIVKETIEANGGKAIMSRVGHSFIKEQMRREKVIFAGELSGHFYYKENNYAESSFITTAMMMNLVSKKKLSQLVEPLRKYFHTGEINLKIKDKIGAMSKTEKAFKGKVVRKDGLSMYFKDWWFNLRPSNTEDLLRLNLEADSKELMEEKKKGLLELIK